MTTNYSSTIQFLRTARGDEKDNYNDFCEFKQRGFGNFDFTDNEDERERVIDSVRAGFEIHCNMIKAETDEQIADEQTELDEYIENEIQWEIESLEKLEAE